MQESDYLKWLEIEESDKARNEIIDDFREEMVGIMSEYHHLFYLQIRKIVADQLKQDVETKTKYQEIEPFRIEERLIPQGFFDPIGLPAGKGFLCRSNRGNSEKPSRLYV